MGHLCRAAAVDAKRTRAIHIYTRKSRSRVPFSVCVATHPVRSPQYHNGACNIPSRAKAMWSTVVVWLVVWLEWVCLCHHANMACVYVHILIRHASRDFFGAACTFLHTRFRETFCLRIRQTQIQTITINGHLDHHHTHTHTKKNKMRSRLLNLHAMEEQLQINAKLR